MPHSSISLINDISLLHDIYQYQGGMDFANNDKYTTGGGYGHLGMSVGGSGGSGSDPFGGSFSGNIPGT